MKKQNPLFAIVFAGLGMFCIILDSRYAAESTYSALEMCLRTVIPSLFPMFVLSAMMTSALQGFRNPLVTGLESCLRLPSGGGGIFLLGLLGGFPVGAQCITQAVEEKSLSKEDAERMLGFCNNCSPAFIFGMLRSVFSSPGIPMLIFLIQLETALLLASLSCCSHAEPVAIRSGHISLPEAVNRSIRSMVSVCAWVILGGVVNGFWKRWLYPLLPKPIPTILCGLLELTGGVTNLKYETNEPLQLILGAGFICFGGVCVILQIQSLASKSGLSIGICIRQKAMQGILGGIIAGAFVIFGPIILALIPLFLLFRKKEVAIPKKTMYNVSHKGGY